MTNSYICTKTTRDNKGAKGQSVSVRMCEQRGKEVCVSVEVEGAPPDTDIRTHTARASVLLIPGS